jgi:parallel beta-helix repeat protein
MFRFTGRLPVVFAVLFTTFLLDCSVVAQTTVHVPGDQATIQGAINVANNGDTVLVAPGTYVENINFNGKAITLTSSGGAAQTIIDGGANGSVLTFNSGEPPSSVLSGFTIKNGFTYYEAGGIEIANSSPTIVSNIITQNHATVGVGIRVEGGSPLIKNNVITNNTQIGSGGQGGGGISISANIYSSASPLIIGNTITYNSVANGGDGGGVSITYYSSPTIQSNLIQGNIGSYGGGIAIEGAFPALVLENIIVNNTARGLSGGGVYMVSSAANVIANNTIATNTAVDGSSGILTTGFPQSSIFSNNIVVAAAAQSAITCNTFNTTGSAVFSHNDVYSASGQSWGNACDHTSYPGNFSADPQFVNSSAGDWHVQMSSPSIDAGDNAAPQSAANGFFWQSSHPRRQQRLSQHG